VYVIEVTRGKQDFTDFMPHNDCSSEYWMKNRGLRHLAFDILVDGQFNFWKSITEEEFNSKRIELLDVLENTYKP